MLRCEGKTVNLPICLKRFSCSVLTLSGFRVYRRWLKFERLRKHELFPFMASRLPVRQQGYDSKDRKSKQPYIYRWCSCQVLGTLTVDYPVDYASSPVFVNADRRVR
ncbi:hypothetical protein M378DRAFT_169785 [Amanita muscaria Koide BX008]|uniref:Uncharacterized protein n=1 Tax=Amanita muscaria (strain Koide BX008) TaxID=946122 RepID=A0A0C2WS36_AMAMK|nr:hypothetical protein M378DRAFT_169785 [Amanita muscaria Koide BX008]